MTIVNMVGGGSLETIEVMPYKVHEITLGSSGQYANTGTDLIVDGYLASESVVIKGKGLVGKPTSINDVRNRAGFNLSGEQIVSTLDYWNMGKLPNGSYVVYFRSGTEDASIVSDSEKSVSFNVSNGVIENTTSASVYIEGWGTRSGTVGVYLWFIKLVKQ